MCGSQNDVVGPEEQLLIAYPDAVTKVEDKALPGAVLLGKYELLKLLGVGAFAKVYHARNVDNGQSVAVKAVSKKKVQENGYTAHIEREVSIMRRLCHQHIVKLFEVLATKTKIFLIMEFAANGELQQTIASAGRFTEDMSRHYFRQLISTVKYCHSRGVFHRDLKLDNILLDENMELKVTDFGLSAVKSHVGSDGLLHTLCGTPAYVAPEILMKKGYDGAKADVWSCGVVLFVMNAGYLPFNDYNMSVLFRKIYRGKFQFPKWVSCELRNLVTRMLDTNPNTRITVNEILIDPWFNQGGFENPRTGFNGYEAGKDDGINVKVLNAFDLISFASGLDMSGLFTDPDESCCVKRFLSKEKPERVEQKVLEVAEMETMIVKKGRKGCGEVRLEGQDGDFMIMVQVYRLINDLVVIEVRRRERGVGSGAMFWRDRLRPLLVEFAEKQPDFPISL